MPAIVAGRVPPHDLDAEAAVLSAILLARDALDRVLEVLKPEHFYSDANVRIYEAALDIASGGGAVDTVSVGSWLRDKERLAQVGGAGYLAQITDATPAVSHVVDHAMIVLSKWRARQGIVICQVAQAELYGNVGDPLAYLDGVGQQIHEIVQQNRRSTVELINAPLRAAFEKIKEAAARGDRITGTATGFARIDAKTAGLHDGDLTIVAARPGMGKTSWVMNVAVNVASPRESKPGVGVAVFSLEMPREQLCMRMACSEGRVDLGRVRQGFLQDEDWRRLTEASQYLSSLPIWIDDASGLSLLELRAKVRRAEAERIRLPETRRPERIGLIVVDYIQLMRGTGDNREQEIASVSRGLKDLAKELGTPIIALSQLNRAVETRSAKDKRPQLADLRESGSIEQDADNVLLLFRREYYEPDNAGARGLAEIDVAKQRNGPTGRVHLRFAASCTRFDDIAQGDYPASEDD